MLTRTESLELRRRAVVGLIVFVVALLLGAATSHAGELIPSFGFSRSIDGGADAKPYAGVALRGTLAPMLKTEIGAAYHGESQYNDQLKLRMWPVTASLYATPVPLLYAGGGVGWYHTTFDYANNTLLSDHTTEQFGVHLGGGMQIPLGPRAGVDLNGRYVMMREQESHLVPRKFNPDLWLTSIGLAIKF